MANDEAVDKLAAQIDADLFRSGLERAIDKCMKEANDAMWDQPEYILVNDETYRWITDQVLPDVCSPAGLKKLFPALKG